MTEINNEAPRKSSTIIEKDGTITVTDAYGRLVVHDKVPLFLEHKARSLCYCNSNECKGDFASITFTVYWGTHGANANVYQCRKCDAVYEREAGTGKLIRAYADLKEYFDEEWGVWL